MNALIYFFAIIVLAKAGVIHHQFQNASSNQEVDASVIEHHEAAGEELMEDESDLEDCICGDEDDDEELVEGEDTGNSKRVKRCGCGYGYGYCGCVTPAAKVKVAPAGPKSVIVVPYPFPAPAVAPAPAPTAPSLVLPQQPFILPQQPTSAISTASVAGGEENVCDRLRLILTLTNQLKGLKLVEIAGHCVVQQEK